MMYEDADGTVYCTAMLASKWYGVGYGTIRSLGPPGSEWERVVSLYVPIRETESLAKADLVSYAARKGWQEVVSRVI